MIAFQSRRGALVAAALLGASAALGGLACGSPDAKSPAAPPPKPLHITFVSAPDANGGTALHVLVRKTNKTDYPRQDYDDVARSLLLESDPNTLEWLVVTPGVTRAVVIPRPADAQVGVYFLFSEPGMRWRHLVDDESVEQVRFDVGRDEIAEVTIPAPAAQPPAAQSPATRSPGAAQSPGPAPPTATARIGGEREP